MTTTDTCLHGSSPGERARLERMNGSLDPRCLALEVRATRPDAAIGYGLPRALAVREGR